MAEKIVNEARRLLSELRFRQEISAVEGLEPLRRMLWKDSDGVVLRLLLESLPTLAPKIKPDIVFIITERCWELGESENLEKLYFDGDALVRAAVLDGSWEPKESTQTEVVFKKLILDGLEHPSETVRSEACRTVQNGSRMDVTASLPSLLLRISDVDGGVRMFAACAAGNLAKRKYNLSDFVAPLAENLKHADRDVRVYSAAALWRISRRHDIALAVASLGWLLAQPDSDLQRARKNAAGALLHHARKSEGNAETVGREMNKVEGEQTAEFASLTAKLRGI